MDQRSRATTGVPLWGWVAIGLVVVLIGWLSIFKESIAPIAPARGQDTSRDRAVASLGCKEWIGQHLKAPSQATWATPEILRLDTDMWSVSGTVDSPNAFGVMLRTTYVCEIRIDGTTWAGTYLTLNGERVSP